MHAGRWWVVVASFACVAGGFSACSGGQQDAGPDASVEAGASASAAIGPDGGTLSACGSTLIVPPWDLATTETITLSCDPTATVAGYTLLSPLYRFEPEGLTFQGPVTVLLAFASRPSDQTSIYWSRPDGSGYDAIPSTLTPYSSVGVARGFITQLSTAFVGQPTAAADAASDAAPFHCTTPSDPPTVGVPCGTVTCTGATGACFRTSDPAAEAGVCAAADASAAPETGMPLGFVEGCDGPEDCPAGQMCLVYRSGFGGIPGIVGSGSYCGTPGPSPDTFLVACHSTSDCPQQRSVCEVPTSYFADNTYPPSTLRTCTTPCTPGPGACPDNTSQFGTGDHCFADPGCDPTCHVQAPPDAGSLLDGALPDGCVTPYAPRGFVDCIGQYPTSPMPPGTVMFCNDQFEQCTNCGCIGPKDNCSTAVTSCATCGGPEGCVPGQYCITGEGPCATCLSGVAIGFSPSTGMLPFLCHADVDCPSAYPFCYMASGAQSAARIAAVLAGNCWNVPPPDDAGVVYGSCGTALDAVPPSYGVPCGSSTCTSYYEECCQTGVSGISSPGTQTCVPRAIGCGGNHIQCDGPEDCVPGTRCVVSNGNGGYAVPPSAYCSGSALGYTVCHTPADCPDGAPYCVTDPAAFFQQQWATSFGSYPLAVCSSSDAGP